MVNYKENKSIFQKLSQLILDILNIIILFFKSLFGMGDVSATDYGRGVSRTGGIGGFSGGGGSGSGRGGPSDNNVQRRFGGFGGGGVTQDASNCVSGGCCG